MSMFVQAVIFLTAMVALLVDRKERLKLTTSTGRVSFWGISAVVFAGFIYDTPLVPKGLAMQAVMLGIVIVALLLQLYTNSKMHLSDSKTISFRTSTIFVPLISAVLFVINASMNSSLPAAQSLVRLGSVIFLVLIVVVCFSSEIDIQDVQHGIVQAVLVFLLLSPFAESPWRPCDQFKCGPFGAIYRGAYSSENSLGIIVSVAILCVVGGWTGGKAIVLLLFPLMLTLLATESRTAQLAMIAGLAVMTALRLTGSGKIRDGVKPRSTGLIEGLVFAIFAVGLVLVYTSARTDFSNRGNIWIRGTRALGDEWITGLGLDHWIYLQKIGYMPELFPHSEYLLLLFSGGIAALVLLYLVFATAVRAAAKNPRVFAFISGYVIFLAVLGLTEAYWNPSAIDGHSFLVIPLIVVAVSGAAWRTPTRPLVPVSPQVDVVRI